MSCTWLAGLAIWPLFVSISLGIICAWLSDKHNARNN